MRAGNYDPALFQESALLQHGSNKSLLSFNDNDHKHFNFVPKVDLDKNKISSKLDPNIALTLLEMGIAHFARHEFETAMNVFKETYRIGSNPDLFHFDSTCNDRNKYSKFDINLFRSKVLNNIGCAAFALGQYNDALKAFDDSLVILRQLFVKAGFYSIAFKPCHQNRPNSNSLEWCKRASTKIIQEPYSTSFAPHLTSTSIEDILLKSADIMLNQAYIYIHIHKEKDAHDVLIEALLVS